jgi:monoamine oxidase
MLASALVAARSAVLQQQHHQQYYVDVLIVGGGLSGLMVAHELEKLRQQEEQQQQQNNKILFSSSWNYTLVEARTVFGGRLANDRIHDDIDLGGAWFWPPDQELVSQLVQDLEISTVEQPPIHPYMSTKRLQGTIPDDDTS